LIGALQRLQQPQPQPQPQPQAKQQTQALQLNAQTLREARKAFQRHDKDARGTVTKNDLRAILQSAFADAPGSVAGASSAVKLCNLMPPIVQEHH
jgi:Ca2+-binding EF-hand superfamily protein